MLRKRKYRVRPKGKDLDSLAIVFKAVYGALPRFKQSQIERQNRKSGRTVSGQWPVRGRPIYDWELDFEKERNQDVIVKINLWGRKGTNYGEVYRTSIARAEKIASKVVEWVDMHVDKIKQRERE